MDAKEDFFNNIPPTFKSTFNKIIEAIESVDSRLKCEIKWGRLTYGLAGDYHHWICGIAQTKKSINLIFHFGGLLDDKNKQFIAGDSFFLRKLEYKSVSNVNDTVIKDFVKQAISKLEYFKQNWKTLNKKQNTVRT